MQVGTSNNEVAVFPIIYSHTHILSSFIGFGFTSEEKDSQCDATVVTIRYEKVFLLKLELGGEFNVLFPLAHKVYEIFLPQKPKLKG